MLQLARIELPGLMCNAPLVLLLAKAGCGYGIAEVIFIYCLRVGVGVTEISTRDGLIEGPGEPRNGSAENQEALLFAVQARHSNKPFCLVQEWTIFRADVSEDDLAKIQAAGHLPLFIFAHKVIKDSRQRFQPGDWVRSSMCISFEDGVMFETKHTVYVLMGPGHEKKADLKTIFSFF